MITAVPTIAQKSAIRQIVVLRAADTNVHEDVRVLIVGNTALVKTVGFIVIMITVQNVAITEGAEKVAII